MFNFQVAENHNDKPIVIGKVVVNDYVECNGNKYPIAEECKSIKGKTEYYTVPNRMGMLRSYNKTECTKVISAKPYDGENPACRPYKVGQTVKGIIINNEFIIKANTR